MYLVHNRMTGRPERVRKIDPRIHRSMEKTTPMEVEEYELNRAESIALPTPIKTSTVDYRGVNNVNSEKVYHGGNKYKTGGPYIKTLQEAIHPISKGGLSVKKFSPKDVMAEIEKQFSSFKVSGKKSLSGGMLKQL